MNNPNKFLDGEVRSRVEDIDRSRCKEWGGNWVDNECQVNRLFEGKYDEKTVVSSGKEGLNAFNHYTAYFEWMLDNFDPSSDKAVFVPCGSKKPIGTSGIHSKKLNALEQSGLKEECDILILSEPCTVIPHEHRLSLPAVNYEFPPEYTDKDTYKDVFNLFVNRLKTWIEQMGYKELYPYLVKGHQNKFDAAINKLSYDPDVYNIPSASYNPDSDNYSGDRFKASKDVLNKVRAVMKFKTSFDPSLPSEYSRFYETRFA